MSNISSALILDGYINSLYIGSHILKNLSLTSSGFLPLSLISLSNLLWNLISESRSKNNPKSINLIPIDYDTGKPSTEKGAIIEAFKANYYDKELRNFESKPQVEDLFDPFSKIQDNIILPKEDPSDEIY